MAAREPKIKNTIDKKHRKLTRKDIHAAAKRLKNWAAGARTTRSAL